MPLTASLAQVNRFTLARHGLLGRLAPAGESPVAMAGRLCGLHAQVSGVPLQSLWARSVPGLDVACLDRALGEERSLVKAWVMRSTLHLIPTADLPLYHQAIQRYQLGPWIHFLRRTGRLPDPAERQRRNARVLAALAEGPLSRAEIEERVPEFYDPSGSWGVGIRELCFSGQVIHAGPAGPEARFARVEQWLPGLDLEALTPEQAQDELLRRYLAAYGPATVRDFAYWSGYNVGDARPIVARGQLHLAQVAVEGSKEPFWLRAEDLDTLLATDPAAPAPPRLLPRFDLLLMGHAAKSRLLDPDRVGDVFRAAGQVAATLLVDGRVAGTWRSTRRGRALAVSLEPWQPLPGPVKEALQAEAERLAGLLGKQGVEVV
jgi:hypothetical protein